MASFEIKSSLSLSTRNIFVLSGVILSGEIAAGMVLFCENRKISMQLDSVESFSGDASTGVVGLAFRNRSPEDLAQLKALSPGDIVAIHNQDIGFVK